jgi:hypothetical protein
MSDLHIYAARPAPPDGGTHATRGRPSVHRRDGIDYWLVAAYPAHPAHALDALLFHAERRTLLWGGHGWADSAPPAGLTHELWHCDAHGHPRVALARTTLTTLTASRGFVELLAHRSLDAAISTYTASVKALTGRPPARVPHLTRITEDGEHLLPAQGAHV